MQHTKAYPKFDRFKLYHFISTIAKELQGELVDSVCHSTSMLIFGELDKSLEDLVQDKANRCLVINHALHSLNPVFDLPKEAAPKFEDAIQQQVDLKCAEYLDLSHIKKLDGLKLKKNGSLDNKHLLLSAYVDISDQPMPKPALKCEMLLFNALPYLSVLETLPRCYANIERLNILLPKSLKWTLPSLDACHRVSGAWTKWTENTKMEAVIPSETVQTDYQTVRDQHVRSRFVPLMQNMI
jgi:hypothetical protein